MLYYLFFFELQENMYSLYKKEAKNFFEIYLYVVGSIGRVILYIDILGHKIRTKNKTQENNCKNK